MTSATETTKKGVTRDWKSARLREVCSVFPGQHILEFDYNRERRGVGYLTGPADFGRDSAVVARWTESPKAWCEPTDVLVTVKGAGVGKVNLAPSERVAIGRQLMAVRPRVAEIDQRFLYYVMITHFAKLQTNALGSTVPGLGRHDIESLYLPLPPLSEQKRIAAILNEQMAAVERARAAAEAQLEAAKALPAASLRAVFNSPEAKQWPKKPLRVVSSVSGGIQKSPGRTPTSFHRPFLTVRNVQRGYLDLTNVERFEITPNELARCRLQEGDLLVVEGNGSRDHIGRNAIFNGEIEDCIHQNHVIRVRSDISLVSPEFVSRYLNSDDGKVQMLEKAKTTTGLYTLSVSKVEELEIPVPSLAEQQRIAARLSEQMADAKRTGQALDAQLATINALPAALLRRAFNGEL